MGWLEQAFGLDSEPEPIAAPVQSRQAPEINSLWVTTRQPSGGPDDLGETAQAFYFVENGVLNLCEPDGKPHGKPYPLAACDDPRKIAGRLTRQAWIRKDGFEFNRRLTYGPLGLA